jgi:hypothetical protein
MPKIERYILLTHNQRNYEYHNCESCDAKAIRTAIYALERDLGLMRGGLVKYFRNNPDNIIVRIK